MILAQMSALSGHTIDYANIHTQVLDHEATLTNFKNEHDNSRHRVVKAYAD